MKLMGGLVCPYTVRVFLSLGLRPVELSTHLHVRSATPAMPRVVLAVV